MKDKLTEILLMLDEIRDETHLFIDDKTLFEQGVDIFLSNRIQEFKKSNITQINTTSKELATDKQKSYLKSMGYNGDMNKLTKLEAFKLIKQGQALK